MIKKRILAITTAVAGAAIIGGAAYYYNKFKKTQKENADVFDEDNIIDEMQQPKEEECDQTNDHVVKNVIFDDIKSDDEQANVMTDLYFIISYLARNNVDNAILNDSCTTIYRIHSTLPKQYPIVRDRIYELINTEFDLNKVVEFNKSLMEIMYTSIDPCDYFVKNGLEILAMGPDCQDDMMLLAGSIMSLMDENIDEAIEVMHQIYDIFDRIKTEEITSDTYEKEFKSYVDKYVSKSEVETKDSEIKDSIDSDVTDEE